MKRQYALAVAWVVGMLFAPDNLILLGNSAGSVGVGIIFLLICSMCVYILHSRCYKNIAAYRAGTGRGVPMDFEHPGPCSGGRYFQLPPGFLRPYFWQPPHWLPRDLFLMKSLCSAFPILLLHF